MSLKRPRMIRSAITGDGEVATQQPLPAAASSDPRWQARSPLRQVKSSSFQADPSIFSISLVDEMAVIEELDHDFLRRCFYCNESICFGADVFMYSVMRAFCTSECRQKQMELEGVKLVKPIKRARNPSGSVPGKPSSS